MGCTVCGSPATNGVLRVGGEPACSMECVVRYLEADGRVVERVYCDVCARMVPSAVFRRSSLVDIRLCYCPDCSKVGAEPFDALELLAEVEDVSTRWTWYEGRHLRFGEIARDTRAGAG